MGPWMFCEVKHAVLPQSIHYHGVQELAAFQADVGGRMDNRAVLQRLDILQSSFESAVKQAAPGPSSSRPGSTSAPDPNLLATVQTLEQSLTSLLDQVTSQQMVHAWGRSRRQPGHSSQAWKWRYMPDAGMPRLCPDLSIPERWHAHITQATCATMIIGQVCRGQQSVYPEKGREAKDWAAQPPFALTRAGYRALVSIVRSARLGRSALLDRQEHCSRW